MGNGKTKGKERDKINNITRKVVKNKDENNIKENI